MTLGTPEPHHRFVRHCACKGFELGLVFYFGSGTLNSEECGVAINAKKWQIYV